MPEDIRDETTPLAEVDATEETAEGTQETDTVPIKELQRVRREAAQYRTKLRKIEEDMETQKKQAELSKLEETERYKAIAAEAELKAAALKQRADTSAKRSMVISEASRLMFLNPALAAKAIDLSKVDIDPDGNVDTDMIKLELERLKESDPYMIKQDNPPAPPPSNAGGGPTNPPPDEDAAPGTRPVLIKSDEVDKMKKRSRDLMKEGNVTQAVKLYNQAWEAERGIKKPEGG